MHRARLPTRYNGRSLLRLVRRNSSDNSRGSLEAVPFLSDLECLLNVSESASKFYLRAPVAASVKSLL